MFRCLIAIALLAGAQLAGAAAKPVGIVTILQGQASVIRALSQFDAAEGSRLFADDLIRTGKDAFLRIEYEDETSIEVGPETILQLNHPVRTRLHRPALYLMQGWLKITPGKAEAGAVPAFATVGMDVVDMTGVIVVHADEASHQIFAQQGMARWIDHRTRPLEPIELKQGDFLVIAPDKAPQVKGRPAPEFVAALPRSYRDTLPVRYGIYKNRSVVAKNVGPFSYADVEIWLDAEPAVRRQFVGLWRRKADNEAFRASLDHDLAKHPEWDPVLHPEKYEPKPPPPASGIANTPADSPPSSIPVATPAPKNP